MATAYKKTLATTLAADAEPTVELIALHCVQYGGHPAKVANPGDKFSMPITEVNWLLDNGAAKLAD